MGSRPGGAPPPPPRPVSPARPRKFTRTERRVMAVLAVALATGLATVTGALIWAHDRVEYQEQVCMGLGLLFIGLPIVVSITLGRKRKAN